MKTRIAYGLGLLSAAGLGTLLAGCPEEVIEPVDAAMPPMEDAPMVISDDDAGRDARVVGRDSGATCGTRGNLGGQCLSGECTEPFECTAEFSDTRPTVSRADPLVPGRAYPIRLYPGGQCQVSCDPNLGDQCNSCSTCLTIGQNASGVDVGECFQTCEQDVDGLGGCNEGYGCDRGNLACVSACSIVAGVDTCDFAFEDRDEDPTTRETIVDEGADFPSACNVTTGLCETMGRAGATAGDDCVTDLDCEDDGLCLSGDLPETPATLRDGYCIRLGCNETDLACQDGDVCTQSLFGLPGGVCMQGCVVGSETTAAQISGSGGGNPGCEAGEACLWDGVHGATDDLNGGCYVGNYNDIPAYNVGASCDTDEECWSPYGLGRCLFGDGNSLGDRVGGGICAVGGCNGNGSAMAPVGLLVQGGRIPVADPNSLCATSAGTMGANNDICVNFSDTQSFCMTSCMTAADCPTGYSCPVLGGTALAPLKLCWPACTEDADCVTGSTCRNDGGAVCNPETDTCFCTNAVPRPDAGVIPRDAGTDAPVPADAFEAADAFESPDAPESDAFAG